MAAKRRSNRPSTTRGGHKYPRSARVGQTLREIVADELVRIDDERLEFVTITAVEVDEELNRARVHFDSLAGEEGDAEIIDALNHHRIRLQASIASQIRAKKTPILEFRPDIALRSAERIDDILRADRKRFPIEMARRKPATTHGLCVVDKPAGVTSHDVVGMLRKRFDERRVGHAGTLDPDATGVLVVAVGNATRLLRFVEKTRKQYVGEVVLGVETSTLDSSGTVTATHDMSGITVAQARQVAAAHLTGAIEQVPPMVSALKVDGRRLHELAREGIEVERQPRAVTISRFDVDLGPEPGVLAITVTCSPGTYVRTLAADLGRLLGGGAHLRNLRRTAVGEFTLDQAAAPDACELLPVAEAVRGLTAVAVDAATAALIANGRVLPAMTGVGPWAVFDQASDLIAVYEPFGVDQAKPAVVLPIASAPC